MQQNSQSKLPIPRDFRKTVPLTV